MKVSKLSITKILVSSVVVFILIIGTYRKVIRDPQKRSLASIEVADHKIANMGLDLTELRGAELAIGIKYRLFKTAELKKESGGQLLYLGNARFINSQGNVVDFCNEFTTVELIFRAEGVMASGEAPRIIMRQSCSAKANALGLDPIFIPTQKISELEPTIKEINLTTSQLYFRSLEDYWPRDWSLLEMNIYKNDKVQIRVSGFDVIAIRGTPLKFLF